MLLFEKSEAALWLGTSGAGLFMSSVFPTSIALAEYYIDLTGKEFWILEQVSVKLDSILWYSWPVLLFSGKVLFYKSLRTGFRMLRDSELFALIFTVKAKDLSLSELPWNVMAL